VIGEDTGVKGVVHCSVLDRCLLHSVDYGWWLDADRVQNASDNENNFRIRRHVKPWVRRRHFGLTLDNSILIYTHDEVPNF